MKIALELPPGTLRDDTDFSQPGRWTDSNLVRWRYGRFEVVGGWAKANASAATGVSRNVRAWRDLLTLENIAIGTNTNLHVIKDGTMYDITPSGLTVGLVDLGTRPGYGSYLYGSGGYGGGPLNEVWPRTWSLANWGENLMASPRGKGLYVWENDTAAPATLVANAPANIMVMLVTPTRQVMALGCNQYADSQFNPMCIRASDTADYTTWAPSSGNNAFEDVLEGGGKIIAAANYGNDVLIWTDTSLFIGYYTGAGNQPYSFRREATNCGAAGPNAAVVVNKVAYWLTGDFQFYTWQAGMPPTPYPCPMREEFKDNLDTAQIDKVCATSVAEFQEVWWFYPDTRDGDENSRYVAVNVTDNTWAKGTLTRTAAIDSGPLANPLFISPDGYAYLHEYGDDADGGAINWLVETSDIYMTDAEALVLVRGAWPDFKSQNGDVQMTLSFKQYPQSLASVKGPYILSETTAKKDFMAQGRLVSVKFEGTLSGTRAGKMMFDAERTGRQ